jgi:hypothetical protein
MLEMVHRGIERMARSWCRLMHAQVMLPVRGYYRCSRCHRMFSVPWEKGSPSVRLGGRVGDLRPELVPQS